MTQKIFSERVRCSARRVGTVPTRTAADHSVAEYSVIEELPAREVCNPRLVGTKIVPTLRALAQNRLCLPYARCPRLLPPDGIRIKETPSPRLRGEGGGEGRPPRATVVPLTLTRPLASLSPQAGRGDSWWRCVDTHALKGKELL